MKPQSIFKGLSLLVVLNFLIKPVWIFLIDRQVQVAVGHEVYGSYFSVLNLSIVLSFLTDAGLANMINQRLAAGHALSFRQIMVYKSALALVYIAIVSLVAVFTGLENWTLLLLVALVQVLTSFFVLLRNVITAYQFFSTDAWLSVVDKLLMILSVGSFLYLPFSKGISIYSFLYLQVLCTSLSIMIALGIVLYRRLLFSAETTSFRQIVAVTFPFTLLILLMSIHGRIDGFLLERLHGSFEAGLYASAFRLLDAANMAGYLAASFLVPFIARNSGSKPVVEDTVLSIRNVLLTGSALIVPLCWVFAADIQQLLYHNSNAHTILITRLCALALPGYFLTHVYGSVLTATARLGVFTRIVLASVVVNILLNVALIPSLGATGCSTAAIVSQSFCGMGVYLAASRKSALSFALRPLLLCMLTAVLLTMLFYAGKYAAWSNWTLWMIGFFVTLLIMFVQIAYFRKLYFKLN